MIIFKNGDYSGEVTSRLQIGCITGSVTTYSEEGFDSAWHCHENAHFSLVVKGSSLEEKDATYQRVSGKLTFYSSGEPHRFIRIIQKSKHINLEIEPEFFEMYGLTQEKFYSEQKPDEPFIILKLHSLLKYSKVEDLLEVHALLLQLADGPPENCQTSSAPGWIKLVVNFLQDNWDEHITLADLSREAGVHPVTVCKLFKRHTGFTIGKYRRKWKVQKALHLLQTTGQSLTSIAYECGFADQSHFIRVFKNMTGFTPSDYQRL